MSDLYILVTDMTTFPPRTRKKAFRVTDVNQASSMIYVDNTLGGAFLLGYQGSKKGVMFFGVTNFGYQELQYEVPML